MQIEYVTGNILLTDARHIIHGCNSKGVMGAGVAKAIRNWYPKAYQDYDDAYNSYGLKLGDIIVSVQPDDRVIHNAITQQDYGRRDDRVYVSYWAIAEVFRKINSWGIKEIAMPKIGSGLAGGNWSVIEQIIENTLVDTKPIVYYID